MPSDCSEIRPVAPDERASAVSLVVASHRSLAGLALDLAAPVEETDPGSKGVSGGTGT
ncbi:MAG: hypothetical protein M0T80_08245 [Actinomycetota bacterium]|nr:hypothetical protein [Actinomycetota bacterium]